MCTAVDSQQIALFFGHHLMKDGHGAQDQHQQQKAGTDTQQAEKHDKIGKKIAIACLTIFLRQFFIILKFKQRAVQAGPIIVVKNFKALKGHTRAAVNKSQKAHFKQLA
jgi:uncharacterized membrane protein YvbJ